ncbi:MAG: lipopolysaccharide assembly protein LapB, partial [Gammaproteobacteria bacterium]
MTELTLLWLLLPVAALSGWYLGRRNERQSDESGPAAELRSDYYRGINYLLNDQPDQAIEVFIKLLEVDADTAETHLALGNLYRRRGEVDRATRIHQNLIARAGLSEDQHNEALLELAQDYLSAGLLDRAEDLFNELSPGKRYKVQALRQLIDIYEQEKDWQKAIEAATELERATGNQLGAVVAHYLCELAMVDKHNGERDGALSRVREALTRHRASVRASLLEGELLAERGDHLRAIASYQRVEDQDPGYLPEALRRMADSFKTLGTSTALRDYLERVMQRHGTTTATLALADMVHKDKGAAAAAEFLSGQLEGRVSVRGIDKLLELESGLSDTSQEPPPPSHSAALLKGLTEKLLEQRPVYQCEHCGFPAKSLHWKCPSCKHWNTVKP